MRRTSEPTTTEEAPTENAFEIITAENAVFAGVIATADMQDDVESGEITVFAPPDAAVQALPAEVFSDPTLAAAFVSRTHRQRSERRCDARGGGAGADRRRPGL